MRQYVQEHTGENSKKNLTALTLQGKITDRMQTGNVVQEDKSKVPVINKALRHRVIWRNTGIAPRNQNDGNEWSTSGSSRFNSGETSKGI
jgi:hypothetical protein